MPRRHYKGGGGGGGEGGKYWNMFLIFIFMDLKCVGGGGRGGMSVLVLL